MPLARRLKILRTASAADEQQPSVQIAFATTDMRQVDQHFGAATAFAIYRLDAERCRLLEVAQFEAPAMDGNEDKLAARIAALDGCAAVYCQAVGASAIAQLLGHGIQPIKVAAGTSVPKLIAELTGELREGPRSWLARALVQRQSRSSERFDAMEADGWWE
jgi:nitrogen fixation protein NifX